jgi:hypothetical protein
MSIESPERNALVCRGVDVGDREAMPSVTAQGHSPSEHGVPIEKPSVLKMEDGRDPRKIAKDHICLTNPLNTGELQDLLVRRKLDHRRRTLAEVAAAAETPSYVQRTVGRRWSPARWKRLRRQT